MSDPATILVIIAGLSLTAQLLAVKLRIPAILFLLAAGILAGPAFQVLDSDDLFGDLLFPIVSLSVAIILFEGALTLNFKELGKLDRVVFKLCTVGILISWLVVAPVAWYLLDISWSLAFLFSAIVTVTGPTVIMPPLKSVRPKASIAKVLRWEGILIDPLGAILAVLVFEFIMISQQPYKNTLLTLLTTFTAGLVSGICCGALLSEVLKRRLLPKFLVNFFVLIVILLAFQIANQFAAESGLITVTIMGAWLANHRGVNVSEIKEFKETLTVLLISGMFIILAARVDLMALYSIAPAAIMIVSVMCLLARPLVVFICTFGSNLSWQEKTLIAWLAPRGIVAAAISAHFAFKLEKSGYEQVEILLPLVFFVIIATVSLQSLSGLRLASWLKVREPKKNGVVIFGVGPFSTELARALQKKDIDVLLTDPNHQAIAAAKIQGFTTYLGDPSSRAAEEIVGSATYSQALILSPYTNANSFATHFFQKEYGKEMVAGVSSGYTGQKDVDKTYRASLGAFGGKTLEQLDKLVNDGARIIATELTDEYDLTEYKQDNLKQRQPLMAITDDKKVIVLKESEMLDELSAKTLISIES
ncbi:cation:proton antiporter [Planctobacterium marinum]|uniref:Sodium/hydrogen exchanger n=1 Tax=Planctobacterium marinum TaxID=1631968 RepID=A0AA48HVA8_9ALTE|nr:sodium/hydrogen exchanger [Planctobacterium marinum]